MLADKIVQDLNTALKSGNSLKVSVLRMLRSEMGYKQIDLHRELNDEDVLGVIGKEVKKRREAIEAYTAGGRTVQAETEKEEMEILQEYMPKQMTEDEIKEQILKIKSIEGLSDFGQVMKVISPQFKGKADGRAVAEIVKKLLSD